MIASTGVAMTSSFVSETIDSGLTTAGAGAEAEDGAAFGDDGVELTKRSLILLNRLNDSKWPYLLFQSINGRHWENLEIPTREFRENSPKSARDFF